jgi:UDP-glucose 4-epimerase
VPFAGITELVACRGEVINLGNDEETTINRLAERTIELSGSRSTVEHLAYEEVYGSDSGFEDMRRRVPCLDKARRMIDFQNRYCLDDILRDVIQETTTAV